MARNDLRAGGGLGGAKRPHQLGVGLTQQLVYIYKNKLSVCLSSDVMFVCRLTSGLSTAEITDRDIGTQMTTGTPGHLYI